MHVAIRASSTYLVNKQNRILDFSNLDSIYFVNPLYLQMKAIMNTARLVTDIIQMYM